MYLSTFASIFALHEDYAVLRKELFDGLYSLMAYYVAKSLVILPVSIVWSLLYSIVIVLATGVAPNAAMGTAIVCVMQLGVFLFQAVRICIYAISGTNNGNAALLCSAA